eukprot:1383117-Amorphochlora_amoeboformis.AAC.4
MTYRVGHHSTSDDSTAYRSKEEMDDWAQNDDPLTRARVHLEMLGEWDSDQEAEMLTAYRKECIKCLQKAVGQKMPPIEQLFTDVYDDVPWHLEEQQANLMGHLDKYSTEYKLDEYANPDDYTDWRYQ